MNNKIALICNINNLMFPLARYLADDGYDVSLFLIDEFDHFLPENDSYNLDSKVKIVAMPWKREEFHKITKKELKKTFNCFDFYIGTEIAPALLFKAGITLNIFYPAGTDLNTYPFLDKKSWFQNNWEIHISEFAICQFIGLKLCNIVMYEGGDKAVYLALDKLNISSRLITCCVPFLYFKEYDSLQQLAKSKFYEAFISLRNRFDFILFSHSRQVWHEEDNLHTKGSDKLILGFKKFVDDNSESRAVLILFEYGVDVERSKNLIESLNIGNQICWMPAMSRKDLIAGISISDLGIGNLSLPAYMYCSACEIVSQKKPLLQFGVDQSYNNVYPYLKANRVEEITQQILWVFNNKIKSKEMSEEAYSWLFANNVLKSINEVKMSLYLKSKNKFNMFNLKYMKLIYIKNIQQLQNNFYLFFRFGLSSILRQCFK